MNTSQTNENPKRTRNERNRSSSPRPEEAIFNTSIQLLKNFRSTNTQSLSFIEGLLGKPSAMSVVPGS